MPLNIVYGVSGTGKSEYCMKSAQTAHKKGKKSIIIVPEQFSHIKEEELIKRIGYLSDRIRVMSFKRLSFSQLSKRSKAEYLDSTKKSMLMAKSVFSLSKELTFFKNAHEKQGFISVLLDVVSEFKRSCATFEEINFYSQNIEGNNLFKQKFCELAKIYKKYQELVDERFIDDEDNISLLASDISRGVDLCDTEIYIDEFFRFTIAELNCIRAFLAKGATVTVALCTKTLSLENAGVFSPVVSTYMNIISLAKECKATIGEKICLNINHRAGSSLELAHLEAEYASYPYNIYNEETHDISLFVAADIYSEVTEIACKIMRDVRNNNMRFKDIAIICGNPDLYKSIIKTVFPVYGIPVFLDEKRELMSHPILIMLSSVFDMLISGFNTKHVISYIKTGYSGLDPSEVDMLENFILAGNIGPKDWFDNERFLMRAKSVFDDNENLSSSDLPLADAMLKIKDKLFKPLLTLKENIMRTKCVSDRVNALFIFFEEISLRNNIKSKSERLLGQGDSDRAKEYAEVYNILMVAFEGLVSCMGSDAMGLERLFNVLCAGLSECKIGIIPPVYDGVFFGDVQRSIVRNVKSLYIVGANDGCFPNAAPSEGILTDDERIYLSQKGLKLAPDTKRLMLDLSFMVYSTINISKEKLYISYPIADLGGGGLRPSVLVGRIKKLFEKITTEDNISITEINPHILIASKQSAFNYVISAGTKSAFTDEIYNYLLKDVYFKARLDAVNQAMLYKKDAHKLDSYVVRELYTHNLTGSVSSFERYSECPFSYFIYYGLRARERKLLDIDTPDIGSLLHRVIDIFSRRVVESGMSFKELTIEDCEKIAGDILTEVSGGMFIKKLYSEKKLSFLIGRLKKLVVRSAWAICEHIKHGDFLPCAFEVTFGERGEMEPLEIDLPEGGKITLIGKIDRVDKFTGEGEVYVKVIDYKTGNKNFSLSDIYNRLSLQLCVYITVLCENGAHILGRGAKPAGMFYFKLSDTPIDTNKSKEPNDEQLLMPFKMSGLIMDSPQIIEAMEHGLIGTSKILPAFINTTGELVRSKSSSATPDQFEQLKRYAKKVLGDIGRSILDGNVDIMPCRNGKNMPCRYCKFHSICSFDINNDAFRQVGTIKDDVIWDMI